MPQGAGHPRLASPASWALLSQQRYFTRPSPLATERLDHFRRANGCPFRVKILYCIGAAAIVQVRRLRHVQAQ